MIGLCLTIYATLEGFFLDNYHVYKCFFNLPLFAPKSILTYIKIAICSVPIYNLYNFLKVEVVAMSSNRI